MNSAIEILHEKVINSPIKNLHWCHGMDLVSVISKNNKLQVRIKPSIKSCEALKNLIPDSESIFKGRD